MEKASAKISDGARIDVIGNANNYPLIIVRGLRRLGYDAHLHLITPSWQLDAPENRYPEYGDAYPPWMHDWRDMGDTLWASPAMTEAVRREAAAAEALILNYDAVSLGASETRPYFCLLTGTDLLSFADPRQCESYFVPPDLAMLEYYPTCAQHRNWAQFCLSQRAAIRQAEGYSFFPRGLLPRADELLSGLGALPEKRVSIMVTETDDLAFSAPQRGGSGVLRVLYGARLTWDRASPPFKTELDYKGSDVFLRGLAAFIQQGGRAELTLFRKGDHIGQTEKLAAELGLERVLSWRDEAKQEEFLEAVRNADVVVDTIGVGHVAMVTFDSMSLGRPVIASAPDRKAWNWSAPLPICHAETAEDVGDWLHKLAGDQNVYAEMAIRARDFMVEHFSAESVARRIVNALQGPASRQETRIFQMLPVYGAYEEKNYRTMRAAHHALRLEHAALRREHEALLAERDELRASQAEYRRLVSECKRP